MAITGKKLLLTGDCLSRFRSAVVSFNLTAIIFGLFVLRFYSPDMTQFVGDVMSSAVSLPNHTFSRQA